MKPQILNHPTSRAETQLRLPVSPPTSLMARGAFIVIEGLDRSGKSTQALRLKERLEVENVRVKLIKFPGKFTKRANHLGFLKEVFADRTTAIGKMIDSYLRSQSDLDDRVIHLLFSANRWELMFVARSPLQRHIISQDYAGFTVPQS